LFQVHLKKKFPHSSEVKLKESVLVGPDIRKLIFDVEVFTLTEREREAWITFKRVVAKFLGNSKDPDYVTTVVNMLEKFKVLGCLKSLKIHFFISNLEKFSENLGTVSEDQGELFHQNIKEMERRYQGRWNVNMMSDC
jgi:hypothetical protein